MSNLASSCLFGTMSDLNIVYNCFISFSIQLKFFAPTKHHFNITETGNKRNRRSRRGQSPSLEREKSASEAEASEGNESTKETLSNFVSSIRNREEV